MCKLSKMALAISAAAFLSMSGMAQATPITINGVTFESGATLVIGTLFEGEVSSGYTAPITAAGQELGGVGIVDAIKDKNGVTIWSSGDNGTELTFRFGGFIAEAPTGAGPININFSGGIVDFFTGFGATKDFAAPNVATALLTASNGTPFLNLVGGSTGVFCPLAGVNCTLQSSVLSGTLQSIGSGVGNGFLDVTAGPGAANAAFDTNSLPGGHDLALSSSFDSLSANGGFAVSGSLALKRADIPEPSTIALLGLGLLAAGASSRRRRAA
ncbi:MULTISPECIES: PEP-CTERM sorting domain-containing protein [unclassified Janthinobacterium]|uniref:PEP-CTERM sorting domain-containing protein n=1 Tax=unclassified Janthinobacterium TaxID=2610881 RepID=UPI001610F297|nr:MULTISPECIES: PEP-CTERM sorting domain-containing protein [unclassified Janthinobacterium]MBB5366905.1 hypothetical protein [Janthinobacterium sp. K2C7]MBB5380617.1 hypothetical protein [Janthinobacterium sp. K2Li3]MBB5385287.1 hypothetical protein [Janthinobacterium sp. K2E3]